MLLKFFKTSLLLNVKTTLFTVFSLFKRVRNRRLTQVVVVHQKRQYSAGGFCPEPASSSRGFALDYHHSPNSPSMEANNRCAQSDKPLTRVIAHKQLASHLAHLPPYTDPGREWPFLFALSNCFFVFPLVPFYLLRFHIKGFVRVRRLINWIANHAANWRALKPFVCGQLRDEAQVWLFRFGLLCSRCVQIRFRSL